MEVKEELKLLSIRQLKSPAEIDTSFVLSIIFSEYMNIYQGHNLRYL